ncbi:MAG: DNA-processing protein DprA [Gemmataceae bacterium]
MHGIGDQAILRRKCLGLICSVQCPGSVVIKTFDAIRELRDAGVVVAGGFHSPMEKECLEFLLRGEQPVIVVLAKGLGRPLLPELWRTAIDARRLLILSPFDGTVGRTTKATAQKRNEFIAAHAAAVLIPHASLGGKAEATARTILECGKPLFTFDDEENQDLLRLGGRPFDGDAIRVLTA